MFGKYYGSLFISLFVPANGRLKMEKDIEDDQHMSRGVHEKKAISGIAAKNGHPTPSSSIAVDMSKRKHSIAD
ncbi:hypothetical protein A2U01_0087948, partial [Trifolium medium]|nr:hypothetical protein [Trifolium medium]